MKKRLGVRLFLAALVLAALADFLARPLLVVESEQGALLYAEKAYAGMPVVIRFIHSVQKTPVEEDLRVDDEVSGFVLDGTRYQSFGVGLFETLPAGSRVDLAVIAPWRWGMEKLFGKELGAAAAAGKE